MSTAAPSVLVLPFESDRVRPDRFDGLDAEVVIPHSLDTVRGILDEGDHDAVVVECGEAYGEGLELAASVVDRYPVETLVATGAAGDDVAERAIEAGVDGVIRGPLDEVSPSVVAHRVGQTLDGVGDDGSPRSRPPVDDRGALLDRALDDLDDVVYVVDPEVGLVAWNAVLEDRLDYGPEELQWMTGDEVYPHDQWQEGTGEDSVERIRPDESAVLDFLTSDGERIPHEFRSVWFDDPVTGRRYRVGVARDVSDRRDVERELRRRNDRLVEFTRSIVADLRSSLESGYAALELDRAGEDLQLGDVESALDSMDLLLDNVLELADHGTAVLNPSEVSLATAVETA